MSKNVKKHKVARIVFPVVGAAAIAAGVTTGIVLGRPTNKSIDVDTHTIELTPVVRSSSITITLRDEVKDNTTFAFIENQKNDYVANETNPTEVVFADVAKTEGNFQVRDKKVTLKLGLSHLPSIKGEYHFDFSVTLVYNTTDNNEQRKEVKDLHVVYKVEEDFAIIDDSAVKRNVTQIVTADATEYKIEFKNYRYEGSLSAENFSVDTSKLEWDQTLVGGVEANIENLDTDAHRFSVVVTVNDPAGLDYDGEFNVISGRFRFRFNNTFIDSAPIKITFNEENTIALGSDSEATFEFEDITDHGEHYGLVTYTDIVYTGFQGIGQDPTVALPSNVLRAEIISPQLKELKINTEETKVFADATDPRNKKLRVEFKIVYTQEHIKLDQEVDLSIKFTSDDYVIEGESEITGFKLHLKPAIGLLIDEIKSTPRGVYDDDGTIYGGVESIRVSVKGLQLVPKYFSYDVFDNTGKSLFSSGSLYRKPIQINKETSTISISFRTSEEMQTDWIKDFGDVYLQVVYNDDPEEEAEVRTEITRDSNIFNLRFENTTQLKGEDIKLSSRQVKVGKSIIASVPWGDTGEHFTVNWSVGNRNYATVDRETGIITGLAVNKEQTGAADVINAHFVADSRTTVWNKFEVIDDVKSVSTEITGVDNNNVLVAGKATATIVATSLEKEGTTHAVQDVVFSSSNTNIAKIKPAELFTDRATIEGVGIEYGEVGIQATSVDQPSISSPIQTITVIPDKTAVALWIDDKKATTEALNDINVDQTMHISIKDAQNHEIPHNLIRLSLGEGSALSLDSSNWTVTGVAPGTTILHASCVIDNIQYWDLAISFNVKDVAKSIALNFGSGAKSHINIGESTTVVGTIFGSTGQPSTEFGKVKLETTSDSIEFTDSTVEGKKSIEVDSQTPVAVEGLAEGEAVIKATSVSYPAITPAYLTVTVNASATKIEAVQLSKNPITINDKNETATAVLDGPQDGTITWDTDDHNVATIDQNGKITPVSVGIVNIIGTYTPTGSTTSDSKSAMLEITPVMEQITDIVFSSTTTNEMRQGETGTATAMFGSDPARSGITWSVYAKDGTQIADAITIDSKTGKYTANKVGTTTVKAVIDGKETGSYEETVTVRANRNYMDVKFEKYTDVYYSGDPDENLITRLSLETQLKQGWHIDYTIKDFYTEQVTDQVIDLQYDQVTTTDQLTNKVSFLKTGRVYIEAYLYNGDETVLAYDYVYVSVIDRVHDEIEIKQADPLGAGDTETATFTIAGTKEQPAGCYTIPLDIFIDTTVSHILPANVTLTITGPAGSETKFLELPSVAMGGISSATTEYQNPFVWNGIGNTSIKWSGAALTAVKNSSYYWTTSIRVVLPVAGTYQLQLVHTGN